MRGALPCTANPASQIPAGMRRARGDIVGRKYVYNSYIVWSARRAPHGVGGAGAVTMGDLNIRHPISTITTPNNHDCWAAASAMVMRRHSAAGTEHVKAMANAAGIALDQGTLPDASVRQLAGVIRLGFHEFPVSDITLAQLQTFLRRGPVVAFGFFNFPSRMSALKHAVAIFGLTGDGTARNTKVHLIDPSAFVNPFTDDWEHFSNQVADITFVLSY